jgi:thioredoxin type arsenate reductase
LTQPRVLFLCTGNACRSQIAEALARTVSKNQVHAMSAGVRPQPLHPLAVRVMSEVGIDISTQKSKSVEPFLDQRFDFIITVCDRAKEVCPSWPNVLEQLHWTIDDPALVIGSDEERMRVFRRVRDEIRQRMSLFLLANKII